MKKEQNRIIAIGDIHGEYYKLKKLIKKLKLLPNDKLIFLGDYINRGLYSKEVIEYLMYLDKLYDCTFLFGNHEIFFLQSLKGNEFAKAMFENNGGKETIDSYGSIDNILKIHKEFFKKLKFYFATDDYLFVHAGIHPDKPIDEQESFDLIMIRDSFIYKKHKLKQKVIFGHTPFETPYIESDKIGIDTGCGKYEDGKLTALVITGLNESFVSVN